MHRLIKYWGPPEKNTWGFQMVSHNSGDHHLIPFSFQQKAKYYWSTLSMEKSNHRFLSYDECNEQLTIALWAYTFHLADSLWYKLWHMILSCFKEPHMVEWMTNKFNILSSCMGNHPFMCICTIKLKNDQQV